MFQKLGEALDRELICFLGEAGKKAAPLMGLGCSVCGGFCRAKVSIYLHSSTPCSLGAFLPAARAQTSSSGLGFWEESASGSQWDLGVDVC